MAFPSKTWSTYIYYAFIIPEDELYRFVVYCPLTIPEEKRLAVAEFITTATEYFMVENFNLNMNHLIGANILSDQDQVG